MVSEGLVQDEGSWRSSLLGTAYLPLAEIARRMAMRENPEDHDIVQLQLTTPTSDLRGSISLAISLISGDRTLLIPFFSVVHCRRSSLHSSMCDRIIQVFVIFCCTIQYSTITLRIHNIILLGHGKLRSKFCDAFLTIRIRSAVGF